SSRRRHTRFSRDWSSDVCSSDLSNRGQKLFAIFAMPDHVHILVSISQSISISDLVRDIKAGSSKFINDSQWINSKFNWQEGFGEIGRASCRERGEVEVGGGSSSE